MPASYIYKPGTYKGPVILVPSEGPKAGVTITTPDGKTFEGSYLNTNEGRHQYVFPKELYDYQDLKVSYNGQEGTIASGTTSYEGSGFGDWQARAKGSIGPGGEGIEGVPGQFTPGSAGYGSIPAYLGDQYPDPVFSNFKSVKTPNIQNAPYSYIDPAAFASSFGALNRSEFVKNASLSKDIALDQLDTELQGLLGYAPAAAALKRGETDADNQFNQYQRDRQIDTTLPNARGDLESQRQRANTYAEGRLPDSITDRSLELGVRSAAADNASAGGFGTGSVAASNVSDTMAAEKRLAIAQYGEGLVSKNLSDASNTLLAPLQYSNAGSQISVMPSLSGSQLASKALNDLNALTTIDPTNALNNATQQSQFATNIIQRTNEFNANLQSNTDQFNAQGKYTAAANNANTANNFALGKFGYDVTYAGLVAGAGQLNTNTNLALAQQQQYQQIFQDMMKQAQGAQQTGAISQGIAGIITSLGGLLKSVGGDSTTASTVNTATTPSASGNTPVPPLTDYPDISSGAIESVNNEMAGPTNANAADNTIPQGTSISESGQVILPNGSEMPGGYEPVGTTESGTVIEPSADSTVNLQSFTRDLKYTTEAVEANKAPVIQKAAALMNSMGYTSTPSSNSVQVGYSKAGQPVYADKTVLRSQDTTLGTKSVNTFVEAVNPFGVFSSKDTSSLNQIGQIASDTGFLAQLTDQYNRGDKEGFVNTVLNKFQKPLTQSLTGDKQTQDGISAAFNAYNLYNSWGTASNAQKGMGIANLGLQAYKTATGKDIASTPIIEAGPDNPGLTVGQGLGLFAAGYNVYSLAKNWNQLNTVQKIAAGSGNASQIANLAQSFKLLGNGTQGAVAGSNAASGGAAASGGSNFAAGLGNVAGGAGIALGSQQVLANWGKGGKQATIQGALGGTAIATGLYALQSGNPYVAAGIIAASALGANVQNKYSERAAGAGAAAGLGLATGGLAFLSSDVREQVLGSFKGSKNEEQVARDGVRGFAQKIGLADKDYAITLANGTKSDIGVDGSGGTFKVADSSKWVGGKAPSKLHSYETDYTNDLDYTAGLGGISLMRLTTGEKGKSIDQIGAQVGNATLKDIGHGKEFTPQNFSALMQNQRAVYAQSGIKSKAAAYELADRAYKEGRIDATDLTSMQASFNMIYDNNGYDTAQKLMAGRYRGIEVAATDKAPKSDLSNPVAISLSKPSSQTTASVTPTPTPRPKSAVSTKQLITKEAMASKNKLQFSGSNWSGN